MIDEFAGQRLPDLPNAGYSSRRQKETSDAILFFMRGVERDRILLLSLVVDGLEKWLKVAGAVWRGLLIDKELLTSVFRYFVLQAGANPEEQLLLLKQMQAQKAVQQWDLRQRTADAFAHSNAQLREEIRRYNREQRRKARHTVS